MRERAHCQNRNCKQMSLRGKGLVQRKRGNLVIISRLENVVLKGEVNVRRSKHGSEMKKQKTTSVLRYVIGWQHR